MGAGQELYERCNGSSVPPSTKIYFPVAARGAKQTDFASLVNNKIKGLPKTRPDLLALLESFQEFACQANAWLPDLATLTNESKHDQFSSQDRYEDGGIVFYNVTVSRLDGYISQCARVAITRSGSLTLESGTELRADGITISGPRAIIGKAPYLQPDGPDAPRLQAFRYLDMYFALNQVPVQLFLHIAIGGTDRIISELAAKA
jgi:hypothetical protein